MRKCLAFVVGLLMIIGVALCQGELLEEEQYWVFYGNFYQGLFKDTVEKMVFFASNGDWRIFTCGLPNKVTFPISEIDDWLAETDMGYQDIQIICHNHWGCPFFTPADFACYNFFRNRGFKGCFCIYNQDTGDVRILEEDKNGRRIERIIKTIRTGDS